VQDYIRYRPTYPARVLKILTEDTGLTPAAVIADIGSGTGISSQLFLDNGNTVFAVEPNLEMRQAAESLLGHRPGFHSITGTAESTTLPARSVDYVIAGQAFHWFDVEQSAREFARILRSPAWVVLLWNTRRLDSTPFLRSYEALLEKYGTDYHQIRHDNIDDKVLRKFFAQGNFAAHRVYNEQQLDFEGLKGRLLSSSYIPTAEDPRFQTMLDELTSIFNQFQRGGEVVLEYDTEIYFGHVA